MNTSVMRRILPLFVISVTFFSLPLWGQSTGILLLAHGGSEDWNGEVLKVAQEVESAMPVEVAFGMATKRTMQEGINRLLARGVKQIVAVPLFISSHSSVMTSIEYLLGARSEAPPELATYAKMGHGSPEHQGHGAGEGASVDEATTPVRAPVPIVVTGALDRHVLVSDILSSRAHSISAAPSKEVVILVAHGPVSDEENARWLEDMRSLAAPMQGDFDRIEWTTVRDDAPEPIRNMATADLRSRVERANAEGRRVLIVPLLLSYGGIEAGIRKRLDGLPFSMPAQALLPDERIVRWIVMSAQKAGDK